MNTEPSSGEVDALGQWLSAIDLKSTTPFTALYLDFCAPLPKHPTSPGGIDPYEEKNHYSILRFDKIKCRQ